ncbi:MAG: L,D-transpeptidase family protein [Bacteroidia bacterium]|nr:L,D-transpeptidase family protein [Bacteroidia bacterium]
MINRFFVNICGTPLDEGVFLFALLNILFCYACVKEQKDDVTHKTEIIKKDNKSEKEILDEAWKEYIRKSAKGYLILEKDTFYALSLLFDPNHYEVVFTDGKKITPLADSILNLLNNAEIFGLEKKFFKFDTLQKLIRFVEKNQSLMYLLELELRFTEIYFQMAKAVKYGYFFNDSVRVPKNFSFCDTAWLNKLKQGFEEKKFTTLFYEFLPQTPMFRHIYGHYRSFLEFWKNYPEYPPLMKDSIDKDSLCQYLIFRFTKTGELDSSIKGNDSIRVAKALKKFQKMWNLEPDGKAGKYTRMALKLSKEEWLWQIQMALDRYRREPEKWPKRVLWLNIPSADFILFDMDNKKFLSKEFRKKKLLKLKKDKLKEDTIVLYSRVVVGKPETPTPLLEGKINEIIIYPYWNVPFKIATEEILPMVQRDTGYLRKKNFEVIGAFGKPIANPGKLPWKRYNKEYFPLRIRQRIGVDNSLGVVKFNFHNPYGVYLHDTNSKRYFKTFYRFQSHGCMRVEKYQELVRYLIREDTLKIPFDTIDKWLLQPEQRKIRIKSALPLKVSYYTFKTDTEWNKYEMYVDIYGLDRKRWERLKNNNFK